MGTPGSASLQKHKEQLYFILPHNKAYLSKAGITAGSRTHAIAFISASQSSTKMQDGCQAGYDSLSLSTSACNHTCVSAAVELLTMAHAIGTPKNSVTCSNYARLKKTMGNPCLTSGLTIEMIVHDHHFN